MNLRSLLFSGFSLSNSREPTVAIFRKILLPHGRYVAVHPVSFGNLSTIRQLAQVLQSPIAIPSSRKSPNGFRTFSTSEDLLAKKCVPCDSKDMRPMTEESTNQLLPKVDGWKLVKEGEVMKLSRSWKVKNFPKGLELFRLVADVAEAEGHHPDLHLVGWNNVTIDIWTHAVGGLTENDFILAAKINGLELRDLLRRKSKPVNARLDQV